MSRLKRDLILSAIDVTREKRDAAISTLIKAETKLRELHKQLARHDKRMAKLKINTSDIPETKPEFFETAKLTIPAGALVTDAPELTIPDFLKRDRAAKAEIEQRNAERKRIKAQVRIEKLKAKQSGETRRVPLTGKDALRYIREGK